VLLIYLFTNDAKSITGIYKIDFDKISFETGIKSQKIAKIIEELKNEVMYDSKRGIVWIIAHTRKQFCRTPNISPKIIKSIENNLTMLRGHCFVGMFLNEYKYLNLFSASPYLYPIQTVSEGFVNPPSEGGGEGGGEGKGIIKKEVVKDGFEDFWKTYPRKVNKKEALASWKKAKTPVLDIIIKTIEKQKTSDQWLKDNGQFIPYPSTWLNQERWNDELTYGGNGNGSYQRGYKRNQERELPPDIAEAADARARKWLDAKNKAAAGKA
jgi:hypothetical protein